ncbi:DUF4450 domain-containing protein [Pseudoduganella namucuonensis]|uniref:DUF4450 domain-containing protein n=1 Tax=Pseudoduganella namucuonensis TaxID=1035707 RepID=A0A1I7JZI4_9BURK|nr:DUF4450 domain-containing protein [Pseudoduganella namucuonensis]SFU90525.1 protein of unknown function [Pseudoduganella namucuonensis]
MRTRRRQIRTTRLFAATLLALAVLSERGGAAEAEPFKLGADTVRPNLSGQVARPLRYRPQGEDFVIENGGEFFNRPLYGGNTGFRVDGGDRPEFSLYLPGRGGNVRLGVKTAAGTVWLHQARAIVARYRPGELHYEIADPLLGASGRVHLSAVAYAEVEGLALRVRGQSLPDSAELVFVFAPGDGARGRRGGDIGTEAVPISQYFQFTPAYARGGSVEPREHGFKVGNDRAVVTVTSARPLVARRGDAAKWDDLPALLDADAGGDGHVAVGRLPLNEQTVDLAFQVTGGKRAAELAVYREAGSTMDAGAAPEKVHAPAFQPGELAARFADALRHFERLRGRVRIDTPDPYLNAAMGALNVAADAVWDEEQGAIMHGAIAWRTKLLGWRGPYALDALGWHERARRNLGEWTARQNTAPVPERTAPADEKSNLARNEAGLHTNGDMSKSHYDMNIGFIDVMLRHLLWTGDVEYARSVWPVLERHLAWERRLFRREYGLDKLPLYEGYAAIWASDDLYYNGGGATHASAYNAWHNHMAARIAAMTGKDPKPYRDEAARIGRAMRQYLWMPERGAFAEYRDLLGGQLPHPSYGLWSFYHTLDSKVPNRLEAARMALDLERHLRPIPIQGPGVPADRPYRVLPSTNWMPYSWSINNVVMGEVLHTALASWQAGRADSAFELAKGALLASLYMGISPGNIGSMNYLDVYRREAQRDFADGSGVMARTLVEGLFGVRPDALAGELLVRPGFPREWDHASLRHPSVALAFRRDGRREHWTVEQPAAKFGRLVLELPASGDRVVSVLADGKPVRWSVSADEVFAPRLRIELPFGGKSEVMIQWSGRAIGAHAPAFSRLGERDGFQRVSQGAFTWWRAAGEREASAGAGARADAGPGARTIARGGARADARTIARGDTRAACTLEAAPWTKGPPVRSRHVDLGPWFNDRVTELFKPGKYLSPRSPHVSLSLPSQGIGAWAGHVNAMAVIDDGGLRAQGGTLRLPNGLSFATPAAPGTPNVLFTSQWDNYPKRAVVPLRGRAGRMYLLMAGSSNFMQSRMDNGEVLVTYTDGTRDRLALRNPESWWPIEQDYFIDDYQFPYCGQLPVRVDLKTAKTRVLDPATLPGTLLGKIDGGSGTVMEMWLDRNKSLRSLELRTLGNDVVIGLMGVTLD